MGTSDGAKRASVERLSPLQSARPPAQPAPAPVSRRSPPPVTTDNEPQIVSRPPALDPEAETWAARFETVPPPAPLEEEVPRKRSGRWKTQVMGSMVPLEVSSALEERAPMSEPDSFQSQASIPEVLSAAPAQVVPVAAAAAPIAFHDVPLGWSPKLEPDAPAVTTLRDAVLGQSSKRQLCIAVTGPAGPSRAHLAGSLGWSLAQSGARVLLVEADFDRPELHEALAVAAPPGAGFSQQLRGHRPDMPAPPWVLVRCTATLRALVEGRLRSPGMLSSSGFGAAIRELRGQHDVLIFHAPSLDKATDLRPLAALSQAVVVATTGQAPTINFGDSALRALI